MKLPIDFNLTENFRMNEFLSNEDKGEISIKDTVNITHLSEKLQELRKIVGSITVNSGYRSVEYNNKIGGSVVSYHTDGLAADIKFDWKTWTIDTILEVINYLGFSNVGLYLRKGKFVWLHVDIGKTWGNKYGWKEYSNTLSYKVYEV